MRSAEDHVGQSFYPHECGSMIECITKQDAIKAVQEAQSESYNQAIADAIDIIEIYNTGKELSPLMNQLIPKITALKKPS